MLKLTFQGLKIEDVGLDIENMFAWFLNSVSTLAQLRKYKVFFQNLSILPPFPECILGTISVRFVLREDLLF